MRRSHGPAFRDTAAKPPSWDGGFAAGKGSGQAPAVKDRSLSGLRTM
ncbi:hypothetical protein SGLAU_05105 [Streptomyces glaucescens]|uniref:Uncharacterized protein n=1 Tax=Streptomyces glaucescens TaxID=1907 RepID=A0A089X002_STRGA|nr:hypothetical protein SGLAU_05105 [Streptomyces glaucescens]